MRQRLALAGQDPDVVMGPADLPPMEAGPQPGIAFQRAKRLKHGLEQQAQRRRN